MKSNSKKAFLLKVLEKAARTEMAKESRQKPPICMGFLHQPQRPHKSN